MCLYKELEGICLFLLTNDPDTFKRWLYGGSKNLEQYAINWYVLKDTSKDMAQRYVHTHWHIFQAKEKQKE